MSTGDGSTARRARRDVGCRPGRAGGPTGSAGPAGVMEATTAPGVAAGADEAAFREYVTERGPVLLRAALLLTSNRADAEDLLQAALVKTYLGWGRISERSALDAYVKRAMVNTQISWWRRRRLEEYPTDDLPDRVVIDHPAITDLEDAVRRALDRLPSRMRAAVVLRYYEDMSETEIADVLGVSPGTVKSTVSRAVAKLRIDAELAGGRPADGGARP